ncbi:hypothetical protein AQPW35_49220 [Rubrivivax pictus]|uniref:Uncharacterized protein n=1 Tax=Pseudaquabacterium pictum TaxID=2315236 RepID=A0A480AWS2_9BURK|nr:hypothetical protein AQPW35_49220 [Rubrivivax pictus]
MRATASVDPPGGNCSTIFTGLLGQAWAQTGEEVAAARSRHRADRRRFIGVGGWAGGMASRILCSGYRSRP